ncbi:MAG: glycosyltransferase family 4 protein [Prevotella sp.]|nr:glycosyltransferase family 4 protein [Prevotella sp.]
MLSPEICRQILTIGPDWVSPKGGIAQVLNSYSQIYRPFNFIATTKGGGLKVLKQFVVAVLMFVKKNLGHEIKVVHIHGASYRSFWRKAMFVVIAKGMGKKVIYHLHGAEFKTFEGKHPKSVKMVLGWCDMVIVLSNSWKEWMEANLSGVKTVVVPNIVNFPENPPSIQEKNSKDLNLLFMGALGQRKGIYDLLHVIAEHKAEWDGRICLYVAGNGEVEKTLKVIKEKALEGIVCYKGWVDGVEKTELLRAADVFVLPSYNEGLPISILEAMSYAKPIISTTVGGIPEIVESEENGFLVNPGDKDGLYTAISVLLQDVGMRKRMGEHSLHRVQSHFPERVAQKLTDVYLSLLPQE